MKKIALNKGFTLIELIIATIILSIGLIGVFVTMKNSYNFLQEIKEKTMAINFARGGMEGVFSIRNTNWQRWGGKKDQCWLKVNPLIDEGDDDKCENDTWFSSGDYVLALATGNSDQEYFFLSKQDEAFNPDGPLTESDWKYLLCEDKNSGIIKACTGYTSRPANYFDSTLFFRQVRGGYLLDKNQNQVIDCSKGDDTGCGDGRFLEKNFCVDVFYFDGAKKKITMCSVMTNFLK